MAVFTGAADAPSGAVATQQAIDGHKRRAGEERLAVRVGLSTGDVSFVARLLSPADRTWGSGPVQHGGGP